MAVMIPDEVPPGKSIGEAKLFTRLRDLPEDCIVYYEPVIRDRYPDFVVVIPDVGVLVLECKGWKSSEILSGDLNSVLVRHGSRSEPQLGANPIRQARDYMYGLMNVARTNVAAKVLLSAESKNLGKLVFPLGHAVVLTQISGDELRTHPSGDLRTIFPPEHVVDADECDNWAAFTGTQLKERLKQLFNPIWKFPPLSGDQMRALRTILHPEIEVPRTPAALAVGTLKPDATQLPLGPGDLKSLDLAQEGMARGLGGGHRLVFGVAGSGKTIVLIARARYLSEALPNGRVLVLCFNVTLRSYLKQTLASCSNVEVFTFHGFAGANGVPRIEDEASEGYGARVLAALKSGSRDAGRYDAVLIDEAQDFEPSWFSCALEAMKEPRDGDLLIVGDGSQSVHHRGALSWKKVGVKAQGRTRYLEKNYRNTKEIVAAAAAFAGDAAAEDGIPAGVSSPEAALRDGPRPLLLQFSTRDLEVAAIVALVDSLLRGERYPDVGPFEASDIGVFYRRNDKHFVSRLQDHLSQVAPTVWLSAQRGDGPDPRQRLLEPGIKLQTIPSAKGLQYKAVIVAFADQLSDRKKVLMDDRSLMYVALTRPEDVLVVTFSFNYPSRFAAAFLDDDATGKAIGELGPVADDADHALSVFTECFEDVGDLGQ